VLGGGLVARYGTLRNRALLQKGISYTCSLFALAVIFFTIEFGIEKFFYQNDEVVDIFAALVGALVFRPLQNFFNKETNRFFFRSPYPIFAAMEELGDKLNIATDPDVLCRAIGGFLGVTIQPTETAFFRVNGDQQNVALISGLQASDTVINDYLVLASLVLKRAGRKMIMVDEERLFYHHAFLKPVSHDPIQERAKQLGVAVIVPIAVRDHFWMIMMLGCKCSGALFDDNDRELLGFVARRAAITFENIELRCAMELQSKKVEERVMKQTEHLRKIYKSQSQFLTDVSHEFKTPLAVLKMHASVFAESKDVQQKKAWYVMDTTLDRLNRLVGNLLDAAQPNGAPKCPCRTRVAVDELLGETCDDCMILAEDQGINLLFTSEQIAVCGEKDKLKEVVLNLLSNALRHTPSGGTISISACARDGQAEITVRDTGTGISCKNLPHVFERFYRIGEGTLTGTGIGLYLCRQIIESHGGTVTAESEEGKGSCFVVRLPLVARVPPGS
jgi:signal transduction histidine kinase